MEVPTVTNDLLQYEARVDALLQKMSLAEKIGQMTQVEKNSILPAEVTEFFIGSVLSGGGGNPPENNPQAWAGMVGSYLKAAKKTRLGIPLIYGVDAVHGHNNVKGAVIFPHNIGLGATRDADLVERIGEITAQELLATNVYWTFAPAVSVPQDIRWGRVYEGFSENTDTVIPLSLAYVRGLNKNTKVLHSFKHFAADGGTEWLSSKQSPWLDNSNWQAATPYFKIDQGDARIDEARLREIHLRPYHEAIKAGAMNIMVSFSSWNGAKMHGHKYLLTDVLKTEWGFAGFLVSDWMALDQLHEDYYLCVVEAINAGLDMIMTPYDHKRFIRTLTEAVHNGEVSQARIDDAVRRILRVKFALGLFDEAVDNSALLEKVGSAEHRALAHEAVRKSAVLLKNEKQALPLSKTLPSLLVAGKAAHDVGVQCGGWSIVWQGSEGAITAGTTVLEGLQALASAATSIDYQSAADFAEGQHAEVGIVVLGEKPYAEGFGDKGDLNLSAEDIALIEKTRAHCEKLIVILLSGRPLIITEQLPLMDAFVAAWLPGTEGQGLADVLFGDYPFTGKLSFSWLRNETQVPLAALKASSDAPLWDFGYGLS